MTCYGLPYVSILIVPLGMLYYQIQAYYRVTSRSVGMSDVLLHVNIIESIETGSYFLGDVG